MLSTPAGTLHGQQKKELIGEYKITGRARQPRGAGHTASGRSGKAVEYAIHDRAASTGRVSVGTDHDTAVCALTSALPPSAVVLSMDEESARSPMSHARRPDQGPLHRRRVARVRLASLTLPPRQATCGESTGSCGRPQSDRTANSRTHLPPPRLAGHQHSEQQVSTHPHKRYPTVEG
ncbi:hypothetical protein ACFQ6U_30675 [Streptomyces sp. NPDC056465]|uniref:ISAzo13-like element transposase-related protein n=1 Tax=unclassified Streptomyces TaxID=2593676 RepID=UPI00368CBA4C